MGKLDTMLNTAPARRGVARRQMRPLGSLSAIVAVFVTAFWPVWAKADEPATFLPNGGWTADFADDSCSLERSFVHEEDTLRLRMRQFVPGRAVEITLASETLKARHPRIIGFEAAGHPEKVEVFEMFRNQDGLGGVVFSVNLTMPQQDGAEARSDYAIYAAGDSIDSLAVAGAFSSDLSIRTGSLEQPLKVMESCLDDLLTGWGLDVQAHRTLSRKAEPNWNDSWLKVTGPMQRDFGQQKGSHRQDVRLLIDGQGEPTACRVLQWPEDEPIAVRLCDALLREARIPPALDKDSQPVPSYFVLSLWAIARTEVTRF